MPSSTKWFLAVLFGVAVGIAGFYVWHKSSSLSIDGFYVETDGFTDTRGEDVASVHFVRVEAYDSLKILRVADHLITSALEGNTLDPSKKRRFLFHFFMASDTAALTQDMVDELAYTNPSIEDPARTLQVVASGYVLQADFAPSMMTPARSETRRTLFYMPRPGIKARDVK
jgi:hypothetical protein